MTKKELFEFDREKLAFTFNIDWTDKKVCIDKCIQHLPGKNVSKAFEEIKDITEKYLKTFNDVVNLTGGEGQEYEDLFFFQSSYNIAIRLVPDIQCASKVWIYVR